jgi:hypothetical protein
VYYHVIGPWSPDCSAFFCPGPCTLDYSAFLCDYSPVLQLTEYCILMCSVPVLQITVFPPHLISPCTSNPTMCFRLHFLFFSPCLFLWIRVNSLPSCVLLLSSVLFPRCSPIRSWFAIPFFYSMSAVFGSYYFTNWRDILIRIRIRGSVPLTYGSCSFRQ